MTMPRGPKGEKRPADANQRAVMVARIATGEIKEATKSGRVRSGRAGGEARSKSLSPEKRRAIAKKAAEKRWR